MKNLQGTGHYLEDKIKHNKKIGWVLLIIGLVTIIFYGLGIIFIGISIYFFNKASNYRKGYYGEQIVIEVLQSLPDSYYLINDVNLPNGYGNIDHIVLGINGIFVIETKNYEGEIRCEGDAWYQYKDTWEIPEEYEIKSPSKQIKGNALKLKEYIDSKNIFDKHLRIWVEGIIVFTNDDIILHCDNPTVPVLRLDQLCSYIESNESKINFSSQELERIANILLRQV